jgi:hypothetical protein
VDLPVISRALNLTELLAQVSAFSRCAGRILRVSFREPPAVWRFCSDSVLSYCPPLSVLVNLITRVARVITDETRPLNSVLRRRYRTADCFIRC